MIDDCDSIFITNFEKTQTKIFKKQLLKRFRYFEKKKFSIIKFNFDYERVFFEKQTSIEKSINFFIINFSKEKFILKSDVNKHWKKEFHEKIIQILKNHFSFFRTKLKKFKNSVKMSIFFKNEFNIKKLKQVFYFLSVCDRRAMNEMLNPLVKKNRVQKMFLNIVSSISFFVFVIWKNEKPKIIINFRRINTRLYFDAYFFFK